MPADVVPLPAATKKQMQAQAENAAVKKQMQAKTEFDNLATAKALALVVRPLPADTAQVYLPRPQYPYEARSRHITGSGVFVLLSHPNTGNVFKVIMEKSTGSAVLDNAAMSAYRQWRLPVGWKGVRMPITFSMS